MKNPNQQTNQTQETYTHTFGFLFLWKKLWREGMKWN